MTKKITGIEDRYLLNLRVLPITERITCIEDRYLSSKITQNKGNLKVITWENYEVVINFLAGEAPNYFTLKYTKKCSTKKEAEKLESQALSIIRKYIKNPNDKFFKTKTLFY